ncbi:MAG TPA: cysteine peptidase family C39 domain-containing protein [Methanobacterium sp.]|nr:cysteine peptidase family C39 domain-containing protein [Methanobacterium sp.]
MNKLMKILIFVSLFTIVFMFTGTVTATNEIVNPEDRIHSIINNTSDNDNVTTGNNITNSQITDELTVNTTGIVMSSTISNCGPASLATVLQNLSINISQDMLAATAETNENGTTMYGLAQAAQKQGLIVKELKLKVNELKPWNIVYLTIDNKGHYSITTSITDTTVYLADSDSGNINMTLADFTAAYVQNKTNGYGYALVITNNSTNHQLSNDNTLTEENVKAVKGTGMGWTSSNLLVKALANKILRNAGYPRSAYDKGRAIWNWVTTHIRYQYHLNTWHSFNWVMIYGWANCCEMARLVVCTARAMGLTARYVYKPQGYYKDYHNGQKKYPGHYWAQIKWGSGPMDWVDLDCTRLYDGAQHYGGFMDNYIPSYGRVRFNGYKCRQYPSEPT